MAPQIVSIIGKSGSGKTTLLEKLIPVLKQRGYRVGVVKHAHHGFDVDTPGKDSWRHKQAGADAAIVVSESRIALVKDERIQSLDDLAPYLAGYDLLLAEGFKRDPLPSVEVFRRDDPHKEPLYLSGKPIIAFVSDTDYRPDTPVFGLDEIDRLADFMERRFLSSSQGQRVKDS